VLLLLQVLSLTSEAQVTKETTKLVIDQIIHPIKMEIRAFIVKADQKESKCDLRFFSVKFKVNGDSFTCDSVIFSKSVDKELKESIRNIFKKDDIQWRDIIIDIGQNHVKEKYELILPIHISRERCPLTKLNEVKWWEIFNDLIMADDSNLNEVILLGTVSMSMNH